MAKRKKEEACCSPVTSAVVGKVACKHILSMCLGMDTLYK